MIELYVEFERHTGLDAIGKEVNIDELGDIDWEEDNNDSEEEFEANYEIDDENDDGDLAGNSAVQNEVHVIVNEGNVAVEDGEFSIRMEFGSRELVISAIKSYTISRGVDYTMYESEPQTFYAKCKGYDAGCIWLIRASLIRKKDCWEIRRYNGKHTCTMGTISQDHAKLDSDTIADAISPLVEADMSIKVKSIIAEVQSRFNYTKYNKNYQRLKEWGEAYTQWCNEIGIQRWMLAFDKGHCWGHMTTNLVESINSVLNGARNLPVTAIIRSTFYRPNELFTRKSVKAHERVRNGFMYSEFATKRVEKSFRHAGNIDINRFDRRNEMFEVRKIQDGSIYTVNLAQRHCNCGHFQVERLPYCHVLACCANQHLDWQARYEGAKVIVNWILRHTTKGRSKSTCYLNEMDSRDMYGPHGVLYVDGRDIAVADILDAQVQALPEVSSG
ncbi:hypothetical protein Ahy_B10g104815 [Arachis hypogaea]|uniref:Uncharacterized protein n=1 Tax=Arachis hypogaea TaxID=3818 RepID=A0A444X6L1_ARAHY|nr:hypothetical protein Ahy_B10g104815 [Arachis hypogaea]